MRKTPKYVDSQDIEMIRYLIDHADEYTTPMFNDSEDGYPELVEVTKSCVIITEFLGGDVHYVKRCYADGTIDGQREVVTHE